MTDIMVQYVFSVADEQALRDAAQAVFDGDSGYGDPDLSDFSLADLAEIVIADRVGGWLNIGLERVDG